MPASRKPLVLLPPSETKHLARRGRPLDLVTLSFPELVAAREALLDAALRAAPATPAGRLYTGVLYAALDIPSLPVRAAREIVIVSAQFGALRANTERLGRKKTHAVTINPIAPAIDVRRTHRTGAG